MDKQIIGAIVRLEDLVSDLNALYHTFVGMSDALENGVVLQPRALFHPTEEIITLTTLIQDNVRCLKKSLRPSETSQRTETKANAS